MALVRQPDSHGLKRHFRDLACATRPSLQRWRFANPYLGTPAIAAGVTDHVWRIDEIVTLLG
jgi:hypothetical protein